MRKLIASIIALVSLSWTYAQQEAQFSNYIMNNFMLNPAVAGSYSYWNAKVGYRTQWVGIDGGPTTLFATIHGPLKNPNVRTPGRRKKSNVNHGMGFTAYSDRTGAIGYSGFNGTYAAHLNLNRVWKLSFGASLGMKEFRLDADKLSFEETKDDPTIFGGIYSQIMPDANLGTWLYSDFAFVGISARQILQSDIKINVGDDFSRLYNHYYITAGFRYEVNDQWDVVPSIMLQSVRPAPVQVDLNTTFWYMKKFGFGISYRHLDAIYAIVEYVHDEKFEFSYAYDLTLSGLNKYSSGTHEIILGARFGGDPKVRCPSKFW